MDRTKKKKHQKLKIINIFYRTVILYYLELDCWYYIIIYIISYLFGEMYIFMKWMASHFNIHHKIIFNKNTQCVGTSVFHEMDCNN